MSSMNPFVVLLVPLLYLLVSTGVLIGFTGLLAALGQSAAKIRSIKSLQPTEPSKRFWRFKILSRPGTKSVLSSCGK